MDAGVTVTWVELKDKNGAKIPGTFGRGVTVSADAKQPGPLYGKVMVAVDGLCQVLLLDVTALTIVSEGK